MRKVELLPTWDCEAGYATDHLGPCIKNVRALNIFQDQICLFNIFHKQGLKWANTFHGQRN